MSQGQLRQRMLKLYGADRTCGPHTDLVVEGFPRSANSFTIRMLNLLDRNTPSVSIAHHTHDIGNLRLAVHLRKPMVTLIRKPEEAILSYLVYSNRPLEEIAARYVKFHYQVLALPRLPALIRFEDVVTDFNLAVDKINAAMVGSKRFQRSVDMEADTKEAHAVSARKLVEKRRLRNRDLDAARHLGAPHAGRAHFKQSQADKCRAYLEQHPQALEVYNDIMAQAG